MSVRLSDTTKSYSYLFVASMLYVYMAYFIERTQFIALAFCFGLLFLVTYIIIQSQKNSFFFLVGASLLFRLLFAFSLPNLSQDFYRFIWDGRLILQGLNPFTNMPNDLMTNPNFQLSQASELVSKMGSLSASHYSNYPPVNQLFFSIAGLLSNNFILGSVLVLRTIIVIADVGTLYFGAKLLDNLGLGKHRIFWYVLNPLVIIELSGNLHFEGVMLFFLVWSMYLLHQSHWKTAAVVLALSISVKLLPLLLLPLFFKKLGLVKSILFYSIVIGINVLLFLPFLSADLIANYTETIGLWFTNFEFNASIYYLIREIGYGFTGYNIIQTTGKIMPILIVLFILYRSFFTKNASTLDLFQSFLVVLSVYLFSSTTVHPWYVINLVLVCVFTKYRFSLLWSMVVVLSYSAYANAAFKENYWLLGIEYGLVFGYLIYEVRKKMSLRAFEQ